MTAEQIQRTASEALSLLPGLLHDILPGGRLIGREYVCGDLTGGPGDSCKVNTSTGKWADFATEAKDAAGGDLVSLLAAIRRCTQSEAAQELAERLGNGPLPPITRRPPAPTWRAVLPVPVDAPPPPAAHPQHGKPSAVWQYLAAEFGDLLGLVCRFDGPDGKQVLPLTYCTDGTRHAWRWQALPEPRPLYGLERLAKAAHVVIVEGEKATDAARRLLGDRLPVITWPGGSNAVSKSDWSPLAGKPVAIWPDADAPGIKAALAVADELARIGATVKIIAPPEGVAQGWDLADAEAEGWTGQQVREKLKAALPVAEFKARHYQGPAEETAACAEIRGGEWPEPHPLPDGLHPVEAFDFDLLPATLRPWAQDICERVQCAPDFVAVGIMTGLGALIGRKLGIRPQARTDWTATANQWGLIVGRPGVLKSPALEQALAPLKRLAARAVEDFAAEIEAHRLALQVAKLRADAGTAEARKRLASNPCADVAGLLDVAEPDAPTLRRYMANDTSPAALGELLRQNPNGLLVFRDELVSLLRGLDREDQAEGRGFYLTGWNGDSPYTFDRITRGMNLHIPAVCLSLLGSTQPGRLAEYIRHAVKGGAADDGLIQRFGLLVWPDTGGDWKDVDRWPDGDAKRRAFQVFERLVELDPATVGVQQDRDHNGEPDGLPFLRFDSDALGLFLEWRTDLETRLRSGELHPALESHLAKYRKLVPGLALVLHLADGGSGPVTEAATLQALAWGEYLESHARRAYGSVSQPETAAAKAILARIRKGDLQDGFAGWQVWRPGWALLSDREQVADALRLLVDYEWLQEDRRTDTGGRPSTVYHVNPATLL